MEGATAPPAGEAMAGPARVVAGLFKSGRVPHALLIEGAPGQALEAFVSWMSMGFLCPHAADGHPCGSCRACVKVKGKIHPDLLTYIGEGKSRAISVDQVREIRAQAFLLPNESERKVLLLKEADGMLPPAQNALLKILEEPPPSAVFILCAENRFRLLETVRSRVSALSLEAGCGQEENANVKQREEALALLEALSRGEESKALALLAGYEKDRQGLADMLAELKITALQAMLDGGYRGGGIHLTPKKLSAFVAVAEETLAQAQHNVGGLLLGCTLCAKLFAVED